MMLLLMYDQNVFASSALMYMNHEYTINLANEYFSNGFNTLKRRSTRLLFVWLYPIRFTQKNKSAAANLLTATISRFITDVMALFVHLTLTKLKLHKYLGGGGRQRSNAVLIQYGFCKAHFKYRRSCLA